MEYVTVDDKNLRDMQEKLKGGKFKNVSKREFNILRATKALVESMILEEM